MDQLASFFWDNLEAVLLFITAIGSLVAASVGLLVYRAQKGSPDILAEYRTWGTSQAPDAEFVTRTVKFHQPADQPADPLDTRPARWLVYEVRIAKSRHKWLAVPGKAKRTSLTEGHLGYAPGGDWTDRIRYDPPVQWGTVLLHPDAPEHPKLLFRVRLRSDFRTKRKVKVLSM